MKFSFKPIAKHEIRYVFGRYAVEVLEDSRPNQKVKILVKESSKKPASKHPLIKGQIRYTWACLLHKSRHTGVGKQ